MREIIYRNMLFAKPLNGRFWPAAASPVRTLGGNPHLPLI